MSLSRFSGGGGFNFFPPKTQIDNGTSSMNEDVFFLLKMGDFPMSC